MFKKTIFAAVLAAAMVAPVAYAIEFDKPIIESMPVTSDVAAKANVSQVQVLIQGLRLTPQEKQAIMNRKINKNTITDPALPSAVDLGMNNVPVLFQGLHGTCVTFAVTAAIDALLDKGDYISQMCSLELGSYLEKYGYAESGWNGTFATFVYDQIIRFGVVSKETQQKIGCAGAKDYPLLYGNGNPMPLTEYKTVSENLNELITWEHIFGNDQVYDMPTPSAEVMDNALLKVKQALAKGNRVTFGTYLAIPDNCRSGVCGKYKKPMDTWALTKELNRPNIEIGDHEMVIYGYDDNAVATEKDGTQHVGLLKLRNSWSSWLGDNGNYYMTYDYFKKYANEAAVLMKR